MHTCVGTHLTVCPQHSQPLHLSQAPLLFLISILSLHRNPFWPWQQSELPGGDGRWHGCCHWLLGQLPQDLELRMAAERERAGEAWHTAQAHANNRNAYLPLPLVSRHRSLVGVSQSKRERGGWGSGAGRAGEQHTHWPSSGSFQLHAGLKTCKILFFMSQDITVQFRHLAYSNTSAHIDTHHSKDLSCSTFVPG